MSWVGTAVCAMSLVWFAFTMKSFGDSFRVGIDENSPGKLVTTGMFAISRNPIYVGFLSFFIGMLLSYFNLAIIISFALFLGAIHRQILREEKFLKEHYGKEYEDYCASVRRYI
jgi:protein-S-isoprenylcysteine O-methyltransferase Ste14